jgi:transcription elongation GreA/GreB family factor
MADAVVTSPRPRDEVCEAIPEDGAGFGSMVVVEDVDLGGRETYTLMTGEQLDIEAGQVSLASPIGRALLGARPGAVLSVTTPRRVRRLHVLSVGTGPRDRGGAPRRR